ncbi:hypothetical protein [Planosporangium mesophilum]|uniref:Uncharacterized protein n=1 Tax=Planosporangium mesophilum TaxID=689768 RepID=A0A8J3T9S9_9ACTN|nr:hypothetical protein [Planosporangium mesophilum]NJC81100.1 hypothetical protein [Planosporangium mesophilum]GII21252.1 hypothetical protein Pme01_08490 [Planosporangium mesophilum]
MTDPAPNATPRPLSEPEPAAGPEARPESAASTGGRPWPAPSPNSEWWLGENDPDSEDRSDADEDTQPIPATAAARPGRHAAGPAQPTVTYSRPDSKAGEPLRADKEPSPTAEARARKPVAEPATRATDGPEAPEASRTTTEPATDAAEVGESGFPLWPDSEARTEPAAERPASDQTEPDQAAAGRPSPRKPRADAADTPGTEWQASQIRMMRGGRPTTVKQAIQRPPRRVTRKSRPPALGLSALLLFGLLAGFFGWVSADPFWMAVGHAQRGTATVTTCAGQGLQARCVGTFQTAGFSRERVAVSALSHDEQRPGVKVPARMVSSQGRIAYTGQPSSLHLRWILGIALVLLCGLGIAWATGAGRLETRRARLAVYSASVGGPLLLALGVVAAAW